MTMMLDTRQAPVATAWRIDPARSAVHFTTQGRVAFVKRATVGGTFGGVTGVVELDEAVPQRSRVVLAVDAASVDTSNARRDKHLRTADFFDVAGAPVIGFVSRTIVAVAPDSGRYRVVGDLTLRGVTLAVGFDVAYEPPPPFGTVRRARFVASGVLDRRHFGVNWDHPLARIAPEVAVEVVLEAVAEEGGEAAWLLGGVRN